MIVDAHCHVWPDHIAPQLLAQRPAGLDPRHDGTISGLLRSMDQAGIDHGVCLGVAAKASSVRRTNEFIGSVDRSRFTPFGTVHPELTVAQNMAALRDCGIVGVKLHPLFQDLSLRDPRVVEIAQALAEGGYPVITHAGTGGSAEQNDRGAPRALASLLAAVPGLTLVACHFGGYHQLDEAEQLIVASRAYLETSWPPTLGELDPHRVRGLIRRHGSDRVVFGSDWPMADSGAEVDAVRALGLEAHETEAILGGTLAKLLNLPG